MEPLKKKFQPLLNTSYDSSSEEEKSAPRKSGGPDSGGMKKATPHPQSAGKNSFFSKLANLSFSRNKHSGALRQADPLMQGLLPRPPVQRAHDPVMSKGLIDFLKPYQMPVLQPKDAAHADGLHAGAGNSGAEDIYKQTVISYLDKGADPCFIDEEGNTALSQAIMNNYPAVAEYLLSHPGMDLNAPLGDNKAHGITIGGKAACAATLGQPANPELLRKIVNRLDLTIANAHGTTVGAMLTQHFIMSGDRELALDILKSGRIDLNATRKGSALSVGEVLLLQAVESKQFDIVEYLFENTHVGLHKVIRTDAYTEKPFGQALLDAAKRAA
jgi:hypothetical protein